MKFYISPSSQEANAYTTGTNEEVIMNLIADALCAKLQAYPQIEYKRNQKSNTFAGHVEESNLYRPDIHFAIHSNALNGKARGCEVFVFNPLNAANPATQFAGILYSKISAITPTLDRGIKAGTMAEVKSVHAPAVLIEIAFHDNREDALWIVSHISDLAQTILLSMLEFAKVKYVSDPIDYLAMKSALKQIKDIAAPF